jgi:RNA polymerase sigma-70 factor (ECF subfamily)
MKQSIPSDLIARCRAGDQAACTELFELAAPQVYRLAYSLLLHPQDAEDVTQEVFVYAFRNLGHYDPERGALHTWLYTITVSRSRNARRRKWLPTLDLSELLDFGQEPSSPEEEGPEPAALRQERDAGLLAALAKLSPRLREAVVLRYGGQLSYKEMSAILNCPEKTAESRVRLAHKSLRQHLRAADFGSLVELQGLP